MSIKSSLAEHLSSSTYILCLIGAALSSSSGIPTFADDAKLGYNPKQLATKATFDLDPVLVWQYYNDRRDKAVHANPNQGHFALAELARWKPSTLTITQNVDGKNHQGGDPAVKGNCSPEKDCHTKPAMILRDYWNFMAAYLQQNAVLRNPHGLS